MSVNSSIGVAFLGVGRMGETHLRNLKGLSGVKVVVVADARREAAERGKAISGAEEASTDVEEAIDHPAALHNGDLVLVHEGYHPVVKAPGTNAYYLNFLAGDVRKINAVNDPHYDWVAKQWDGNPLEIPLRTD